MSEPMDEDHVPPPSDDDRARVRSLLLEIGGPRVSWGAREVLNVLLVEHRMRAERKASQRLTHATWALAIATIVLALATVGLIVATLTQ